jgi:hypothetical protein
MCIEMTNEQKLFWEADACQSKDETKSYRLFLQAARGWRERGKYCGAGMAHSRAFFCAPVDKDKTVCVQQAGEDFLASIRSLPQDSNESLTALCKVSYLIGIPRRQQGSLRQEFGRRLLTYYGKSDHAENYLLKGLYLITNLEKMWEIEFPATEITSGYEGWSNPAGTISIACSGAFNMFLDAGDYHRAQKIIGMHPEWFHSPKLRGWKAGLAGFLATDDREQKYAEAERAFGEGEPGREEAGPDGKKTIRITNDFLMARYFGARKLVEKARGNLANAQNLIIEAARMLDGQEFFFFADEMTSRFRVLLLALAHFAGGDIKTGFNDLRSQFTLIVNNGMQPRSEDIFIEEFLDDAHRSLDALKINPHTQYVEEYIPRALKTLAKIPLIGREMTDALKPAIGERAYVLSLGNIRTWVYRALENITNENSLRTIILRLLQSQLPLCAQIVHGPLEHGKDIVALTRTDTGSVCYMYQVKCGDIDTAAWRDARAQLEEMFHTNLPISIVSNGTGPKRGVLIYTGHANPHVAPLIDGWVEEQRRDHNREYILMNIDSIVQWIADERLWNEFRLALAEVGITQ